MPTGDGLLVRLVPADSIPPDAFIALCAAARAHGNGTMEVTARGSLQVRGLTPASAPLFASEVARLDIAAADGVAVLAGPLRDRCRCHHRSERTSPRNCGGRSRRRVSRLAPKVSVVVDGGGRLHLDALTADVRLRAVGPAASVPPPVALELGRAARPSRRVSATPDGLQPMARRRLRRSGRSMSCSASCARSLRRGRPHARRM